MISLILLNSLFNISETQLFQQATPDTSNYMIGGFAVIFISMLVYLISLIVRGRNLRQDLEILQEMEDRSN